ncbi:MAG: hypothetical protein F6K04_21260 [Leptolyngbya sp. SIO4C5]|nr:hypothetical protein [Leptolyngbya sp. SIO4C5]
MTLVNRSITAIATKTFSFSAPDTCPNLCDLLPASADSELALLQWENVEISTHPIHDCLIPTWLSLLSRDR